MSDEWVSIISPDGAYCDICGGSISLIKPETGETNCYRKHLHPRIIRIQEATKRIHCEDMDLSDEVWDPERVESHHELSRTES